MELFLCHQIFFSGIKISKNGCENHFPDDNEKYAADPEIRFSTNSILKPFGLTGPCRQRGSFLLHLVIISRNLFSAFLHEISTLYRIRNTHQINIEKVSWVWTAASSWGISNKLGFANTLSVVISKVHKLSILYSASSDLSQENVTNRERKRFQEKTQNLFIMKITILAQRATR